MKDKGEGICTSEHGSCGGKHTDNFEFHLGSR